MSAAAENDGQIRSGNGQRCAELSLAANAGALLSSPTSGSGHHRGTEAGVIIYVVRERVLIFGRGPAW